MVLEYVDTLKWPAIIAVVVVMFRANIAKLIDRTRSVKGKVGPTELEIGITELVDGLQVLPGKPLTGSVLRAEYMSEHEHTVPVSGETTAPERVPRPEPGVRWAASLAPLPRNHVRHAVRYLHMFADGSVVTPLTMIKDPAAALYQSSQTLHKFVKDLMPPNAGDLWPETPQRLVRSYQRLGDLEKQARESAESVTPMAAHEFNKAAKLWAREYAEFVENALRRAEELAQPAPEGPDTVPTFEK